MPTPRRTANTAATRPKPGSGVGITPQAQDQSVDEFQRDARQRAIDWLDLQDATEEDEAGHGCSCGDIYRRLAKSLKDVPGFDRKALKHRARSRPARCWWARRPT